MSLLNWDESYSVKVAEIDEEHKKLIGLINEFHDGMVQEKEEEAMDNLFTGLINYTSTHFATEEKHFAHYGYPESEAHKKEHDDLIDQVTALKQKFDDGELVITLEVMNFLKDWLIVHIQETDMKFSEFFNSKGLK